eukprot:5113661-Pyramimonas_sp.AAC.1
MSPACVFNITPPRWVVASACTFAVIGTGGPYSIGIDRYSIGPVKMKEYYQPPPGGVAPEGDTEGVVGFAAGTRRPQIVGGRIELAGG